MRNIIPTCLPVPHRMAQWARTVQLQEPRKFGAIEIERELPENWKSK